MKQDQPKEVIELLSLYDPDCNTLKFREITEYERILSRAYYGEVY